MNPIFDIDYGRLAAWLTPIPLRSARMLAWLRVQVSPVVVLYQAFGRNRTANLYGLGISPQVCYLEKLLNDRFDTGPRRIYIGDPQEQTGYYIYQDAEDKPLLLYTDAEQPGITTYTDTEAGVSSIDFVVFVPVGLLFNRQELLALLDVYKLAGTSYLLNFY